MNFYISEDEKRRGRRDYGEKEREFNIPLVEINPKLTPGDIAVRPALSFPGVQSRGEAEYIYTNLGGLKRRML